LQTSQATEAPFEIALLLDTSGSRAEDVGLIVRLTNRFHRCAQARRPRGDRRLQQPRAAGPTVTAKVDVLSKLTGDRKLLRKAIENLARATALLSRRP